MGVKEADFRGGGNPKGFWVKRGGGVMVEDFFLIERGVRDMVHFGDSC
jgi:hypothetical protein